ncbi:MAG: leucine-rich repeat domain-containing protein [Clostridiales bacterium]|nr:leucine-rich repeat domain-containing protein [Clostridiales bacterium]
MAKKKKILFWVLVPLISALIIAGIVIGSVMSCAPKSGGPNTPVEPGPDDPVDDPPIVDPPHQHKWVWTYTTTEHWQYCADDFLTQNRDSHEYRNSEDTVCKVCGYVRKLPTKQENMDIEFDEDGNAKIGGAKETIEDLVIPGTVKTPDGKEVDVVEISEEAFRHNNNLNTLTILDGVKKICKDAFSNCSNLKEIYIPKTVTDIDPQAFQTCQSLTTIIIDTQNTVYMSISNCIIKIEDRCLIIGCNGSTIPTRKSGSDYIVTSIGDGAFYGSGIKEIAIPSNITEIGSHAFHDCKSLTKFTYLAGVTQIRESTFSNCTSLTTVIFNDGITEIGANAFDGCTSLDNLTLPATLTIIKDYVFRGCSSLNNITLNEGLVTIAGSAFRDCTGLESITLPSTIRAIGLGAFSGCTHLTEIVYAGTEDEWQANVVTGNDWKPNNVEVSFTEPDEEDNHDTGDSGDTADDADNASGSGNGGTDD